MASLACGFASNPVAAICNPLDESGPFVLEREMEIRGRESRKLNATLGAGSYLIVAREGGVDVQLSIVVSPGAPSAADSPLARTGTQLLMMPVPATVATTLIVAGKDDPQITGKVTVRIRAASGECLKSLQPIAAAHASYARAEAVRHGINPDATKDAPAEYRNAVEALRVAIANPTLASDRVISARTKLELAIAHYEGLKEWREAEQAAASAQVAYVGMNDAYGAAIADALRAMALMEMALSGNAEALLVTARRLLGSSIRVHAARGEIYEQALAQNNLGLSYFYEGRADEAMSELNKALDLHEELHEPMRRAQVQQNIAVVYLDSGRFSQAVPAYDEVLALLSRDTYPQLYASVLSNSALANAIVGNIDVALERYSTALAVWTDLQNPRGQARSRNGLGYVYYLAGDYERAQDLYEQALAQRTTAIDGAGRASTLRTLGNLHRMFGRSQIALDMHREALTLAATPIARDGALIQIARDFASQSNYRRAIGVLDWVIDDSHDALTVAYAKLERGRSRADIRELPRAEADVADALDIFRTYDLPAEQTECLVELARIARLQGDDQRTLPYLDEAMALTDGLRAQSLSPELKATLVQPARAAANLKIEVLSDLYKKALTRADEVEAHRLSLQALMTSERARARVLNELRSLEADTRESADVSLRRENLYRQLAEGRYEFQRLSSRYGSGDARSLALRESIARNQVELDRLNRISAAPRTSEQSTSIDATKSLPGSACVIAYWVDGDRAHVWSVTKTALHWRTVESFRDVESTARSLLANLGKRGPVAARTRLAGELGEALLDPVAPQCLEARQLYIIADGVLHYVPFAMLPDPTDADDRPIIASRDVAFVPALSMMAKATRVDAEPATMLLVSDPVYGIDDERFDRAGAQVSSIVNSNRGKTKQGLSRLRFSAAEADSIADQFDPGRVSTLTGLDATRTGFLSRKLDTYDYIHVIAHGQFDAAAPRLSAMILSTFDRERTPIEGRVWSGDITARKLQARLVVLSGCETALGRYVHGEGLMGLQYAALGRGAESVLATFWSVPDMQTAQFMRTLYERMRTGGALPAQALGATAREAMNRGMDPAVWGAFNILTTGV